MPRLRPTKQSWSLPPSVTTQALWVRRRCNRKNRNRPRAVSIFVLTFAVGCRILLTVKWEEEDIYLKKLIVGQTFDAERSLYNLTGAEVRDCVFAGPADGE